MIFGIRTLRRLAAFETVDTVLAACALASRCGAAARAAASLAGRKSATWSTGPYGELALTPRRPDAARARLADRAPRAAAAQRDAPDDPQPQRHDRSGHQQLHRGRRRRRHPSSSTPDRTTSTTSAGSGAPPTATSAPSSAPIRMPTTRPARCRCRRCARTPTRRSWACLRRPRRARRRASAPTARCTSNSSNSTAACWKTAQPAREHCRCASSTRQGTPPTTCAWCWRKTACSSRATHPQWQHHGDRPARRQHDRVPRLAGRARRGLHRTAGRSSLPAHGRVLGFARGAIAKLKSTGCSAKPSRRRCAAMPWAPSTTGCPSRMRARPSTCGRWRRARCRRMWSASANSYAKPSRAALAAGDAADRL